MGLAFNADEIFEMAEQIERNGAKFYREAAGNSTDESIKRMLLGMAAMEDSHLETFAEMRQELTERETATGLFDPDNEAALYLQTMADSHGSEGMKTPAVKLTGNESVEQVLNAAIDAEKNSVLFYVGLKDMVSVRAGKDKVEAIIKEEIAHIATLSRKLKSLQ